MPRKRSATVDLKVRMKEPLRARLEKAAKENGVSMNVEAVGRLEQSFQRTDVALEALGGEDGLPFIMILRPILGGIREKLALDAETVWSNPGALVEFEAAINGFFKHLRTRAPRLFGRAKETGFGAGLGIYAGEFFVNLAKATAAETRGMDLARLSPEQAARIGPRADAKALNDTKRAFSRKRRKN